jgi:hypothetical protein
MRARVVVSANPQFACKVGGRTPPSLQTVWPAGRSTYHWRSLSASGRRGDIDAMDCATLATSFPSTYCLAGTSFDVSRGSPCAYPKLSRISYPCCLVF